MKVMEMLYIVHTYLEQMVNLEKTGMVAHVKPENTKELTFSENG